MKKQLLSYLKTMKIFNDFTCWLVSTFFSVVINHILLILAGNDDMHKKL